MWRSGTPQRALARLVFRVARAAEGGEAFNDLLSAVPAFFYQSKSVSYAIPSTLLLSTDRTRNGNFL
jgi:hypothetical protein